MTAAPGYPRNVTFAYHRLFRILPEFRWWKPLAALLMGVSFYYGMTIVYQEVMLGVVQAVGGESARTALVKAALRDQQDASNPLVLLFTLGSLSTMLPAVLIAVRLAGLGRFGQLTSVLGRIRWRWLLRCLIPGVVYAGVTVGLSAVIPDTYGGASSSSAGTPTPMPALILSCIFIVLLVPFQASAEEFAFRGFGMQAVGSYFRWPIVAIILPNIGFALAHNYNIWGQLDVACLGVAFAYLTWRTGGLEAGIIAHVVNNVLVFLLAAPVVATTQAKGSPIGLGITVVASLVYVAIVTWLARRSHPDDRVPGKLQPLVHRVPATAHYVGRSS